MNQVLTYLAITIMLWALSPPEAAAQRKEKKGNTEKVDEAGSLSGNPLRETFFEGMKAYATFQYDLAVVAFEKCLKMDPRLVAGYLMLSNCYREMNDRTRALAYAQNGYRIDPGNLDMYQCYYDLLMRARNYTQAAELINVRLGQPLSDRDAIRLRKDLAKLYEYQGNYELAAGEFDKLEAQFGYTSTYAKERLRLYEQGGNQEKALLEAKKLADNYPNNYRYVKVLARMYGEMGEHGASKAAYQRVLLLKSNHGPALLALGQVMIRLGEIPAGVETLAVAMAHPGIAATEKLETLKELQINGLTVDVLTPLATILAQTYSTDGEVNAWLATIYWAAGDETLWVSYLERAREADPSNFQYLTDLLQAYSKTKEYKKLRDLSAGAAELYPTQTRFYAYAAEAFTALGDYENALMMLETGLVYVVTQTSEELGMKLLQADIYDRMGQGDKARDIYEWLLTKHEGHLTLLNNYAYFLANRGQDLDKALGMAIRVIKLHPGDPSYMDTYAWVLFKKGAYTESAQWLTKALDLDGDNPDILEHYGDCLYFMGDTLQAVAYWQKAQDAGATHERLNRKIREKKYHAQ
jgi:tetratricopeptide (TPR) repeat protein